MATTHELDRDRGHATAPAGATGRGPERAPGPGGPFRRRWWHRRRSGVRAAPRARAFAPAEHSGVDDGSYRPGRVTKLLLWCGAVDRDLLSTRTEYYRYANLGGFVLLVSVLAGVTFVVYVMAITGGPVSPAIIPFAALWALLIFFLDRSIVGEPSYGDLRLSRHTAADGGRAARWGDRRYRVVTTAIKASSYVFRVVVALLVAYLIGEAILLVLFRPEIQQELAARQTAAFAQVSTEYVADKQQRITDLDRQLAARAKQRDDARAREDELLKELNDEASGRGGSGFRGDGRLTRLAEGKYRDQVNLREAIENQTAGPDQQDQAEKSRLSEQIAALRQGDPAAVAAIPDLAEQERQIKANTGWVEQEAALAQFLDENGSRITVAAVPWIVRGILLAIDLTPILLKLANSTTLYGQRQYDRANRLRHSDAVAQVLGTEHIDRMAEIDRIRSEAAAAVVREREEWHRDWRLHYIDAERDTVESDRRR